MTIIELAKEILEFYSTPRTITLSYSKKSLFKNVGGVNFYENKEIYSFAFSKSQGFIEELNTIISDKNFNMNIYFHFSPLSKSSIQLIEILISKLKHLDRDIDYFYLDEKDKIKLIKNNNFNALFFNYLHSYLTTTIKYSFYNSRPEIEYSHFEENSKNTLLRFGNNLNIEIESITQSLSKNQAIQMIYASVFSNTTEISSNSWLTKEYIRYLNANNTNFPLFKIDEKPDEIQQILKDVCPILLKIGDIENFLKLFAFSDFNVNDTSTIVPIITWCIENNRDDLIQQPLDILKRIQPYHSQILEAEKFLEKQQLIRKSDISLTDINQLSGIDFESLVIEKLKNYNHIAKIERTPTTKDFGADIILVTNNETKIAIQCKRFSSKVNLKAVQEITAALKHYNADIGIVISNNGFLPSAIQLAASNNIELWGSEELLKLITQQSNFSVLFEC